MKNLLFISRVLAMAITLFSVTVVFAEEVKIGAWNIQYLGAPEKRPKAVRGIAQKPEDLATYIRNSGVSILCLEEMCDDIPDNGNLDNSTLDKICTKLSDGSAKKWKYQLFKNRSEGDLTQVCGILWNENRVTAEGEPYRVPIVLAEKYQKNTWDRHPTAMKFSLGSGKTDVVVIPLHMKSNVGASDTAVTRKREAYSLMQAIEKIEAHFNDKDILLLGDTNIASEDEGALEVFEFGGFKDLNEGGQLSSYYTGKVAFDRIFVRGDQLETKNSTMEVEDPIDIEAKAFFKSYSDHYMVVTTVKVMTDDDQ